MVSRTRLRAVCTLVLATLTGATPLPQTYAPAYPPHWESPYYTSSDRWAGAVLGNAGGITAIQATVTLPRISLPPGGDPNAMYEGGLWVGIDGWGSCEKLLQVIIRWTLQNGQVRYIASHEWAPDETRMVSMDLEMKAGDKVTILAQASNKYGSTGGETRVWNRSTGKQCAFVYRNQPALQCQQFAAVIVETFVANYMTTSQYNVAMPAFSPITFENIAYTTASGSTGAMGQDLTVLASRRSSSRVLDSTTLRVTYQD